MYFVSSAFQLIEQMDEESRNSRSSRISRSSQHSFYSLEKPREPRFDSCSKPSSILNIMDIQVPESTYRGSGYMANEEYRTSGKERSSNFDKDNYSFHPSMEEKDINRKSNYKTTHECDCANEDHCNGVHCSCFLTPREICVIGQCCRKCIQSKNSFLMTTRGWAQQKEKLPVETEPEQGILAYIKQKNLKNLHYYKQVYAHDPSMQNLIFCTCKKSHCQKKYCLCFEKGMKCGQYCNCIECQNRENQYLQDEAQEARRWERYAIYKPEQQGEKEIDHDIDQYMEHNMMGNGQFNEVMEFQPPDFERLQQYQ